MSWKSKKQPVCAGCGGPVVAGRCPRCLRYLLQTARLIEQAEQPVVRDKLVERHGAHSYLLKQPASGKSWEMLAEEAA